MRAIRLHSFGPAENLSLEDLPDLTPSAGEVRIAVRAAGVHLVDTRIRSGEAGPMPLPDLPTIPGREVAGTVDAVGAGVDDGWLDARVVAHLGAVPGGYADQAVTATANLFRLPDAVDFGDAIAAVGTGRTALGVLDIVPIRADDTVLVTSAAGGLGWLLMQAAREAGARVVAVAGGARKVQLLGELSPDLAVNYTDPGWQQRIQDFGGVTVAYDGVGGEVGRAALELLRPGGRLAMFGFSSGTPTRFDSGEVVAGGLAVTWCLGPAMMSLPGGLPALAARSLDRLAAGRWRPLVSDYPLAEAARAHADLEQRRAVGKVVLRPT